MAGQQEQQSTLKRGLKNRHIQIIALGGAVGTGLFLTIAQTIKMAGPSVILGYAIGGFIAFLIMRQLGEMVVEEPVAGSFSHFAYKYWGDFAGFLSGWNYWAMFILVGMSELTAVGIYIQHWWPDLPTWIPAAIFFVLINLINLVNVRLYGETEFWFSIIKVIAIIGMIIFGGYLLISGNGGPQASVTNLWQQGGFIPNGLTGLIMAMAWIMFSFGGLETVGIAAAEAENPEKNIPKATNQVVYRILLFYVGSLAILLSLYPWDKVVEDASPFVLIFYNLNSFWVANILNVVVLTAALSVYNSGVYCNSRMLYGLAKQGNAPKALTKVNKRSVPVLSIALSALVTSIGVLINYVMPKEAFHLLMSLVVTTLVINWIMICLAHLKFRTAKNKENITTKFRALWHPFGNYLCLAFLVFILVIILLTPSIRISVILMPFWIGILWIGYLIAKSNKTKEKVG
ncbi:amino acid permease [Xenorhabdus szentirmaii]|uniref:Aromatic amino acid transport protein AroP n=2 Tax=Xenorhabdus szentirmaii TaxID=290112 RepID=W1IUE1_9GAMM|nr:MULTISPECIES: amino acid permease [Xenorhabdus]MBD2782110.1 amino acid permease [Xenorhabdus sp. 38]MBD2791092.1 amino acid permease [Xenorhabdus sp. CUL]MBD2800251.1 amino acid permease [Xenorhabdus sp. M]MBD2805089.1 amino acid permease [Xenorhabdus sp. ZM]MBD2819178.1 amino acid permease [Xenorhabdus sp. 42]